MKKKKKKKKHKHKHVMGKNERKTKQSIRIKQRFLHVGEVDWSTATQDNDNGTEGLYKLIRVKKEKQSD